jgi:DnaJ-class molecular chaperone
MLKWKNIEPYHVSQLDKLRNMTPYERLDVLPDTELSQIKLAYRKKVRQYHPDRASSFMTSYFQEMTKLFNITIKEILEERGLQNK